MGRADKLNGIDKSKAKNSQFWALAQRNILAGSKLFYDNASLLRWLNKDKNSIGLENHDVIFLCAGLPAKVHSLLLPQKVVKTFWKLNTA